jgi:hypothetical protein
MFTNKNTPLLIAIIVADVFIIIGFLIKTPLIIGISIFLAVITMMMGIASRRMTHMWLTDDVRLWAREIRRFEQSDRKKLPSQNAVVFVGSSTIRFWSTLAEDMSPLPVIQRGFGGSRMLDSVHYADKIVIPYNPSAVVVFSGTNDISGKTPKSAEYVSSKFKEFCAVIHASLPQTPIYFISITPTPGRWKHWPTIQEANRLIEQYTDSDEHLHFIDTTSNFLDETGLPQRKLYRWDRIHLNSSGYKLLTAAVREALLTNFPL